MSQPAPSAPQPGTASRPRPEVDVVVAIDVGGTAIKCALVDRAGTVRHARRHPTGAQRGPDAVLAAVLDIGADLAATARRGGHRPVAAGIVVPGVVDEAAGTAIWSANVGFRDTPVREPLRERLGLPVALGHDVRAGGLAEATLGAGSGHDHVLFVAIGTGIAAAYVVGGRVLTGAHGAAGELGHLIVRPGGPACGCGAFGCLEVVASATAVARRYEAISGVPATAARVVARAAAGDRDAAAIWADALDALATGLLAATTLYDPEIIVLGGGLAEAGGTLLRPLGDALAARVTFQHRPALARATLGDQAGCLGAGLLALALPEAGAPSPPGTALLPPGTAAPIPPVDAGAP